MPFVSPKRYVAPAEGKASWYSYYAGFSAGFARQALTTMALPPKSRIVDCWNGSGTTTEVADDFGLVGVGYDVNPVMVMVAKARLLPATIRPSHDSLCEAIIRTKSPQAVKEDEPLEQWFSPRAARCLRLIEISIQKNLVSSKGYLPVSSLENLSSISSLAAFFYVALFRVVRHLTDRFRASNPTWMKIPNWRKRIRPSEDEIYELFRENVNRMALAQWGTRQQSPNNSCHFQSDSTIELGDSRALSECSGSVSAVLGSPPYCTRIDYAIATRTELAVLGFSDLREIRERMLGSAVIEDETPTKSDDWGPTCVSFVDRLSAHHSKASKSYYLKNHLQYFSSLAQSIRELDRILCSGGQSVLVVQDSFYKDIHNDLPKIVVEMGGSRGWSLLERTDFVSSRHMGQVNPNSKTYRSATPAIESVLWFKKN